MNIFSLGFAACALLLSLVVQGCDEPRVPPLPPGGSGGDGGGDEDAGMAGEDAGTDSGVLGGDLCGSHLSGISCQVEEIAVDAPENLANAARFCARFTSGDVKCWGYMAFAVGDELPFFLPGKRATRVAGGNDQICLLLEDNSVYCHWQHFAFNRPLPPQAPMLFDPLRPIQQLAPAAWVHGENWVLFGDANGVRWTRPVDDAPPEVEAVTLPFVPVNIVSILNTSTLGQDLPTSCALTDQGEVRCWGTNDYGTLGTGDTLPRTLNNAQPVPLGEPAVEIAMHRFRACAVTESGALKCWGAKSYVLGKGEPDAIGNIGDDPGEIEALGAIGFGTTRKVVHVAMYGEMACATFDDGSLRCWGENVNGVLGRPTAGLVGDRMTAVRLGTGRRARQVVVGNYEACALLDDHSVKCWGAGVGTAIEDMGDNLARVDLGRLAYRDRGPIVEVTAPARAIDPLFDPILDDSTITARCSATQRDLSSAPVDPASVVMSLHGDSEFGPVLDTAVVTQIDANLFEGVFRNLESVGSGRHWIECAVMDSADPPMAGSASSPILYDGGPDIVIVSPGAAGQVVGRGTFHLSLRISPSALGGNDPRAGVVDYQVTVAGVVIPLTAGMAPNEYEADVDLRSSLFEPPPSGPILISVEATNARGRTHRVDREIVVDVDGPTITASGTYVEGTLVRGVQIIQLRVTDELGGTNPSSVRGYVANDPVPIVFAVVGDHYEATIDTLQYGSGATQLPLRITATDQVGNVSELPLTLRLDNVPPIVSLDPPAVRETKRAMDGGFVCSAAFDPVGTDSVDDQQIAPEGAEFRARIEDQNPLVGNGVVATVADVDPMSASVYMTNDLSRPILIDTDGDGECDALNDELDMLNENLLDSLTFDQRDLISVMPTGQSYFPGSADTDGLLPAWDGGQCEVGADAMPPARLCSVTSPLTRVIKASIPGVSRPAIWGLPMIDNNNCVGRPWDWRLQVPSGGPVCVVAAAADRLGNLGVSVPLRVCLQRSSGTGIFDCGADTNWRNHDCLSGTYMGQQVSCDPPPDFEGGLVAAD